MFESTLMQVYLASLLPEKNYFNNIQFWHHPLIYDMMTGDKLSKSAHSEAVNSLDDIIGIKDQINDIASDWMDEVEKQMLFII